MIDKSSMLEDSFARKHNYLRISLTERCNLRCSYCMPIDGVQITPSSKLMNSNEIYEISKIFVSHGVNNKTNWWRA